MSAPLISMEVHFSTCEHYLSITSWKKWENVDKYSLRFSHAISTKTPFRVFIAELSTMQQFKGRPFMSTFLINSTLYYNRQYLLADRNGRAQNGYLSCPIKNKQSVAQMGAPC